MPFFSRNKLPLDPLPVASQQPLEVVCTWSAHAPQPGSSPSPFPRSSHTLTATGNAAGELFLFGGLVYGRANSDLYLYSTRDFSTTLLKTSGEVPTPRLAHGAALIGTTFLICGGRTGAGVTVLNHDLLYFLNLETRVWSRVVVNGPGPGGRSNHTTKVVGSKLFVFGGQCGGKNVNDMWTLDLNCLKSRPVWESYEPTPGNEKPPPRRSHVSVTTKSRIIIFGGIGDQYYLNDTWSFDISTRKWAELQCTGSIPSPRSGHAAVVVDGFMYVFGGSTGTTDLDDLIALQLSTQRWFKFRNVGQSPHRKSYHAMASDGTRVFVVGGKSVDDLSFIHVFDIKDIDYPESAQNERYHRIAELTDELSLKSALLEQAKADAADQLLMKTSLLEQRDAELIDVQAKLSITEAKLDELVVSRDQQVGQYEKELKNMRAKLEAKESELETVRLRLTDAEKSLTESKAEADRLRTQTATSPVNGDADQVTIRLLERMRAIEAEVASKRWNEKSIEEMECRNEG